MARLTAEPEVTLPLVELPLESGRNPETAEILGDRRRTGLAADVAFNAAAGLPGEEAEIALYP